MATVSDESIEELVHIAKQNNIVIHFIEGYSPISSVGSNQATVTIYESMTLDEIYDELKNALKYNQVLFTNRFNKLKALYEETNS